MPDVSIVEVLLSPWLLALLGLVIGSFVNVIVHRMPMILERQWWGEVAGQLGDRDSYRRVFGAESPDRHHEDGASMAQRLEALPALGLAWPGSRCPSCGHVLRWYENVPVLSYLTLRGRCSACSQPIGWRYLAVEALTAVLFVAIGLRHGATLSTVLWCAAAAVLLALALIDWDTTVLPDALTQPLLWAGLLAAGLGWLPGLTVWEAVVGATVGYLSLWTIYWLFKLVTGKEGMGYGDFKLLGALGAWLGWQALLPVVLVASALGAVVGLVMKASGGLREGRYVPFGPFLAGGGLGVMLLGPGRVLGWMGW